MDSWRLTAAVLILPAATLAAVSTMAAVALWAVRSRKGS